MRSRNSATRWSSGRLARFGSRRKLTAISMSIWRDRDGRMACSVACRRARSSTILSVILITKRSTAPFGRPSSQTRCAAPPLNRCNENNGFARNLTQWEQEMADEVMSDARERQELADELAKYGVRVAQPDDPPLFTKEPKSTMQPYHWKAVDLARLLEKIGASLKLEQGGQRRTLRLTNPGLPYGTTPTFWASIQYILPGEIASAHRHAATALRFIMEGSGADTIVDGEQYIINEGDLVLTPSWTWHDHEHRGSKPMIWLDVLDISLVRSLHATFFEGSSAPRQNVNRVSDRSYREFGSGLLRPMHEKRSGGPSPVLAYTWPKAQEALSQALGLDP